jgi:hypothetical protein
MVCTIHQPNFLPYLGFFHKFKNADIFVLYDTAQYSKNEYHNRNRIRINNQATWLTVPVSVHLGQKINEAKLANTKFIADHLLIIKKEYEAAPFFNEIFSDLTKIYQELTSDSLIELNVKLLRHIFKKFDPTKKIFLTSELPLDFTKKSTEALIDICRAVKAEAYLSGAGAKVYLDEKLFIDAEIKLEWQEFHHPVYEQGGKEFIPNLSIIDSLFYLGYEGTYKLI